MDVLQRYRELRSMGFGESRAKASAAIEVARETSDTVAKITERLETALRLASQTPTRSGGLL